jgi:hypothetical protein
MNTVYRKAAKNAKFTSFLFSFERKENKSYAEKIYLFFANFASLAKRAVKKYSHLPA